METSDKQLKESIASLMKDKNNRDALAEMLVEFVEPGHIVPDFISMLLNTRSLKVGDSLVKKIRKGITVHTLVPGSIHLASEVTVRERINYVLDGSDVKVTFNTWDMENGDIGTVESIRGEMLANLKDHYQRKVFTALSSIWSAGNTPHNYTNVGGALTSTALKNAIDYLNNNVGRVKAVVGLRALLNPITTWGGFWSNGEASPTYAPLDPQLQEIMQTGWLGKFYGAPIIALDQQRDNPEDYTALLPTSKVLVIAENVGEFVTYGDVKSKMYDDLRPTPPQTFLEIYQQYGMIVDNAQGIYVLDGVTGA
jgi:hypothetical protein